MSETPKYLLSTLALTDEQRTALEQELLPLARSAALGALTADIAHDLANPLFAVLGHVDLLLLDAEPGSPLEQRLRLVRQTALELKDGLRTLLDFARPPEGVASAALDDAARVATALVRHGYAKELQITATYPAGPVVVDCPPGDVAQAVLHLVAAAREAAGDAGSIEVVVTADGVLRVRPAVADGLGVVAAARIAADHGGSLEADGDALVLRLPVRAHEVAS
jgi:two-component system sensor histidine kinase PilS (NtrC family)